MVEQKIVLPHSNNKVLQGTERSIGSSIENRDVRSCPDTNILSLDVRLCTLLPLPLPYNVCMTRYHPLGIHFFRRMTLAHGLKHTYICIDPAGYIGYSSIPVFGLVFSVSAFPKEALLIRSISVEL